MRNELARKILVPFPILGISLAFYFIDCKTLDVPYGADTNIAPRERTRNVGLESKAHRPQNTQQY